MKDHYDSRCNGFYTLTEYLMIKERKVSTNLTKEQQEAINLYTEMKKKNLVNKVKELISTKSTEDKKEDEVENVFDIVSKFKNKIEQKLSANILNSQNDEDDENDFIHPNNQIMKMHSIASDLLKNKNEIDRFEQLNQLGSIAEKSGMYSFLWFKTLLQIEKAKFNISSQNISIIFSKVELEEGKTKTLILKHPNQFIPMNIVQRINDEYSSHQLEKLICGDEQYLEKNSVVNGHELINIYNNLGKKYEFRFNVDTIDVVCNIDDTKL